MSSIKTTQIDGDISVGRNVTMGGKAEIAGSVQINHNIKIKGWLDAPNVATPMKGLFSSEERLKAAYDDLREGWYALVHTGNGQAACWVVQDGKWKNTGDTVAITQGASIADFMDEVNTAIEAEAKDRYQGDAELNAKILQEVADRKTADDAESAARITADNNLSTLINTEIADRESSDNDLSNRIDAEKSARETADADLSGRIDDEVTARTTADDALDKDKEKRRKVYSFQLVDALTTSSTHADIQKAFTTHFNDDSLIGVGGTGTSIKDVIAIPGAGDRLIDVWNKLTIYLDDQQQRAVITSVRQYETELSGLVGRIKKYDITYSDGIVSKTITLDAQNADLWKITSVVTFDAITEIENLKEVLQDFVSEEATARANADTALSERIDTEATTRANADNDLSKRIGAEATARANVDANLSSRIDTEVTERETAENELASRITDEMNVRSTAVQRLDNMLSEETQARFTADDNLAGLIDDTKSYLNTRIDEEAQTRLTEDNKKKNKDFVMRVAGETITTPEGVEFSLIDTEPQTLASVILHGECDIVLSDGIRNDYRLDHVWLSDGMPYGYKLLEQNQRLNIATVVEVNSGNNKLVCKFNDDVRFDDLGEKPSINSKELVGGENTAEELDLCRKPIVLKPKVDENGQRIYVDDGTYLLEGATPTEIIQAMQLRRPLYLSFDGVEITSYTQIPSGLIPLTYRSGNGFLDDSSFLYAYGNDGLAEVGSIVIGGYLITGLYVDEETDPQGCQILCIETSKTIYDSYNQLSNKPSINGVELSGNKTSKDLKLQGVLRTSADLTLRDDVLSLTDMAKKQLFIDLWNQAAGDCGRYNEDTGFFELFEIYDIGWDEAMLIWRVSGHWDYFTINFNWSDTGVKTPIVPRAFLPCTRAYNGESAITAGTNFHNDTIQYLSLVNKVQSTAYPSVEINVVTNGFRFPSLIKIDGQIQINSVDNNNPNVFNMPNLIRARFKFKRDDYKIIYFRANLRFTYAQHLFRNIPTQNANGQCVFKLAANMYNRLNGTATDYEDSGSTKEAWMALADLAASKNITLATE